jgi:hypothetical protein
MTTGQEKTLEIDGRSVRVSLSLPDAANGERAVSTLLVCERPDATVDVASLLPALGDALAPVGWAMARFDVADTGPPNETFRGDDLVREAVAVLEWIRDHPDVDHQRLGVLGIGAGSIVAATLAGRVDSIAGVCLLDPVLPEDFAPRRSRNNGRPSAIDTTRWPAGFFKSLAELEPAQMLRRCAGAVIVLQGAGDRIITPASAWPYLDALANDGRVADHELIALGDERMDVDEIRAVYVDRLTRFFQTIEAVSPAETSA